MADRRSMHHDVDVGTKYRRWSSKRQRCTSTISQAGPFDVPFICRGDEAAYVKLKQLEQVFHFRGCT